MKPHRILKKFSGSQTGHDHHVFEEGCIAHLSDDLAAIVVKEGWAEPHTEEAEEGLVETPEDGVKSEGAAPQNKAIKAAPQNKAKK